MKSKTSKEPSKAQSLAADRRAFMKNLMTGTAAVGLASTLGKAEAAPLPDACFTPDMGAYFQERNARSVTRTAPEYYEFDAKEELLTGFPGGGIWVAVGPEGSEGLQLLRRALESGDYVALSEMILALHQRVVDAVVGREGPYKSLAEIPALLEVTYSGKMVAGGLLVVPGTDVILSFLPYSGGALNPKAFQLTQYASRTVSSRPHEALVIARRPVLTDLEKAIFEQLPAEVSALNLGDGGLVANWGVLAAGVVFAAVWVVGAYMGEKAAQEMRQQQEQQQRQMEQELNNNNADQDQGQQADDKNNGGSLKDWMTAINVELLEKMEVSAAATKLLQLRSNLVQGKLMATP